MSGIGTPTLKLGFGGESNIHVGVVTCSIVRYIAILYGLDVHAGFLSDAVECWLCIAFLSTVESTSFFED